MQFETLSSIPGQIFYRESWVLFGSITQTLVTSGLGQCPAVFLFINLCYRILEVCHFQCSYTRAISYNKSNRKNFAEDSR